MIMICYDRFEELLLGVFPDTVNYDVDWEYKNYIGDRDHYMRAIESGLGRWLEFAKSLRREERLNMMKEVIDAI